MIGYVIGDNEMLTGFRLAGLEGTEAYSLDEVKHALDKTLARSDIAIIILSETLCRIPAIREQVDKIRQERVTPLIVELPSGRGSQAEMKLSEAISKILGIKL